MPRKGENIYKRKDGRWEARYVKGCTTEGKTAYGYCYGKTYREAKAKVTEAKARLVQNLPHTGGGTRRCFSSYCDEWLKINRSKVKESTYVKYLSMLDKHIKPKLGNYYVQSLSSVLIEQFSYELLSENGLSPKTVRDILTLLRSILKYVSRQLPSMPHIDIVYPKDSRKEQGRTSNIHKLSSHGYGCAKIWNAACTDDRDADRRNMCAAMVGCRSFRKCYSCALHYAADQRYQ